jgi:hypothetical protein
MQVGLRKIGWITMTVLASLISAYAAIALLVPNIDPPFVKALRAMVPWAVVAHFAGGIVAMAVGPWQLSERLRARAINAHRWIGRSYVVAVLVGGTGALVLAPLSQEGLVTHVTLRIYLPLSHVAGIPYHDAYQVVSWLCWVPNLVVAEWVVLRASLRPAPITDPGEVVRVAEV